MKIIVSVSHFFLKKGKINYLNNSIILYFKFNKKNNILNNFIKI